jgi:hypothetical protein
MASHGTPRYEGPETIEDLTVDRERMWHGFTSATTGVVVFMVILLIGMAVFLL